MKAAVLQAAPVLFDREATLDKTESLVREAAAGGAEGAAMATSALARSCMMLWFRCRDHRGRLTDNYASHYLIITYFGILSTSYYVSGT